jgi:hypothetical protein
MYVLCTDEIHSNLMHESIQANSIDHHCDVLLQELLATTPPEPTIPPLERINPLLTPIKSASSDSCSRFGALANGHDLDATLTLTQATVTYADTNSPDYNETATIHNTGASPNGVTRGLNRALMAYTDGMITGVSSSSDMTATMSEPPYLVHQGSTPSITISRTMSCEQNGDVVNDDDAIRNPRVRRTQSSRMSSVSSRITRLFRKTSARVHPDDQSIHRCIHTNMHSFTYSKRVYIQMAAVHICFLEGHEDEFME